MITLEFYPADVETARKGVLIPHKKDKPFIVECDEKDLESVIKKQVTGFTSYVINYYLGNQRFGVKYEGHPYYTVNGKFLHPLKIADASLETVVNDILSSCGFYNGIKLMSKEMVNAAREKTVLRVVS